METVPDPRNELRLIPSVPKVGVHEHLTIRELVLPPVREVVLHAEVELRELHRMRRRAQVRVRTVGLAVFRESVCDVTAMVERVEVHTVPT